MPDPNNALSWGQSPPQFSGTTPWDQAQPAPDYHDALSQAWHESYSRNNPADYEANYRAPYYSQGEDQIVQAFNDQAAARFARQAQSRYPTPEDAQTALSRTARMAQLAQVPLSYANPLAVGAMGMNNVLRSGDPGAIATAAGTTALNRFGLGPIKSMIGGGLLGANMPSDIEADPRIKQTAPTQLEQSQQVDPETARLETQIQNLNQQRLDTIKQLYTTNKSGRGKNQTSTQIAPSDATITGATKEIDDQLSKARGDLANLRNTGAPFAEREGGLNTALTWAGPALSAGTGLLGAAAFKPTSNPLMRAIQAAELGVAGGAEGMALGALKDFPNASAPAGSRARKQFEAGMPSWLSPSLYNTLGPFVGTQAQTEAGMSAAASILPSLSTQAYMANRARKLSETNALAQNPSAAGSSIAAPSATGRPQPLYLDSQGREVHLGAQGKPLRQDKIGRWIDNTTGRQVPAAHRPLWFQSLQQSGNALKP